MIQKFHLGLLLLMLFTACKDVKPIENITEPPAEVIKNISVEQAKSLMDARKDIVLIDVRTPEEWEEGSLPGTINIDVESDDFTEKVNQLDKDVTYLVHCRKGSRSEIAIEIMEQQGFKDIYHMLGGYLAWIEE